jgi:RsmE family RNA methyltransferase
MAFDTFVGQAADERERRIILVEPGAELGRELRAFRDAPPERATLMIGPEGGWTDDEMTAATAAAFVPCTLGPRTLRADAAPLVAIAVIGFLWNES